MAADGEVARPPRGELVVYALLALFLLLAMALNQRGLFVPDIKPEVYLNPWHRLSLDLSTWLPDPYLGTQNYNLGLAPVDLLSGVLQSLGIPGELTVRVLRYALLLLAGAGMWLVVRRFAPESDSPWSRVAAVTVYVLNPYAVVAGSTLAILLPYALFPWFLVAVRAAMVRGGWGTAARAALVLALMTGMNVGAVPLLQLVALPAVAGWLVWSRATTGARALAGLLRTGALSLALSIYWLVPALAAMGTATAVVDNSETLEAISGPSGWGEVLRGLGLWPMYGGSAWGPWQPGFLGYLSSPLMVIGTFGLLLLALLGVWVSRSKARVLAVGLLLTVGVVMVGVHPPDSASPFGAAMRWVLETVPGMMLVRTTNKAGAGLALALALLIGLLAHDLAHRPWTSARRLTATAAGAAVVLVAVAPVWTGNWNVGRWDIPGYWRAASADLDSAALGRLWMLPGQVLAGYRWSTNSVDDVNGSFLGSRSTVVRTALPTQDAHTTNLLYQADAALQGYRLRPDELSSYARLLGVSQVLLRSDVSWRENQGLAPGLVYAQVTHDPGLALRTTYGAKGQNTVDPGDTTPSLESELHPLAVYDVKDPTPSVSAWSADRAVVIAGDAAGIQSARLAGLVPSGAPVLYASDLSAEQLAGLTGATHRWVLTDTNRRTNVTSHTLRYSTSALRGADDAVPETRALGGATDQTTLRFAGIANVRASDYAFSGHGVDGNPTMAVDGNPATSWLTGAFGTAAGQWIEVDLGAPRTLGTVTITTAPGTDVAVDAVRITFGGQTRELLVRPDGTVPADLSGLRGSTLRVEIARTSGAGGGYVGIKEIALPGGPPLKGAALPSTLSSLARAAGTGVDLSSTPVDVVLTRTASQDWFGPAEETSLYRTFDLPAPRTYRAYGLATAASGRTPAPDARGCLLLGRVDGQPLRVKPLDRAAVTSGKSWLYGGCRPMGLTAGAHTFTPDPGVVADSLVLRDFVGDHAAPALLAAPSTQVIEQTSTHLVVKVVNPTGSPVWLSTGGATDPGWHATVDGASLGAPSVLNGASMSWQLPAAAETVVTVDYGPQRAADLSRWFSLAFLLLCLLLAVRPVGPAPEVRAVAARWVPARPALAAAVVGWSWLTQGWGGAVLGVVLAALVVSGLPSRRSWFRASVVSAALAPLAWLVGNNASIGMVSAALVLENPAPGWLAWLAVTLAAVGLAYRRAADGGPAMAPSEEPATDEADVPLGRRPQPVAVSSAAHSAAI